MTGPSALPSNKRLAYRRDMGRQRHVGLGVGLVALGVAIAVVSVLGPLVLEVAPAPGSALTRRAELAVAADRVERRTRRLPRERS